MSFKHEEDFPKETIWILLEEKRTELLIETDSKDLLELLTDFDEHN